MSLTRRRMLRTGLGAGAAWLAEPFGAAANHLDDGARIPVTHVIDAHIHLFDPTRSGGVPWPEPDDVIYKPTLPRNYQAVSQSCGVVGAIAIEASPLASDNDWVLGVIAGSPLIVGMIGDLVPGSTTYHSELERLHRNPLFLGIRYGNLWKCNLATDRRRDGFMDGMKALAETGLVFETANPDPELIGATLEIVRQVPDLTVVIDHLPHAAEPSDPAERKVYWANIAELGRSANVYAKLSEIIAAPNGRLRGDVGFYAEKLDRLWNAFGAQKLIYGSDWPNSEHIASYADTFALCREYVALKGNDASDSVLWKNSQRAYRWRARQTNQHEATRTISSPGPGVDTGKTC